MTDCLPGAGLPQVLGEQVRHRVAQLPVRQPVKGLQGGIAAYPPPPAYISRPSLEKLDEPHRGAEDGQGRKVVENVAEDRAVLDERQFLFAKPQVGMQALPQHGVGDVEAVKIDVLSSQLAPEHGQRVILAAQCRHLEIDNGGPEPRPGAVFQLVQQPRFPDPADTGHIKDAWASADPREFRGEIQQNLLAVHEWPL